MNDQTKQILEKHLSPFEIRILDNSEFTKVLKNALVEICDIQIEQTKQDIKDREGFGFGKMVDFKNVAKEPNYYESF